MIKRRRKAWRLGLSFLLSMGLLASCNKAADNNSSNQVESSASAIASEAISADSIDMEFSARDLDVGYEESTATQIVLGGTQITVNGPGASTQGSVLTISEEGTYVVSGSLTDGHILVDAADTAKIQIVLKGAAIHCFDYAPVFIKSADKVFLTLAQGTENTISDGDAYVLTEDDSNVDGAIFSRADLTINGSGLLAVIGNQKHGIVSKDDLVITGGEISVTAAGDGLCGKDCVKISDGIITVEAGSDAIQSDNAEDSVKGYVYIRAGNFNLTAGTDGIQAETVLRIDGGSFTISTGGGSANATKAAKKDFGGRPGQWGQTESSSSTESDMESRKGLKSGSTLLAGGGNFALDCADDALHSNGDVSVTGGDLTITTGDDAIHADSIAAVSGGTIAITKSYEGIEGSSILISGGTIDLKASDDGLNAASGETISGMIGGSGQSSSSSSVIRITGGSLTVDADGDGLDSNGSLAIEGGTVWINGPTSGGDGALDYDSGGTISGGTFIAVGSSGMAQGFTDSSTQYSILHNFSSSLAAGEKVVLTDTGGNEILTFTPCKAYQSVVISSPDLKQGETYQLSAGSQTKTLTLGSVVTSNGSQGMMGSPGGQNQGGFPSGGKGDVGQGFGETQGRQSSVGETSGTPA